MEIERIAVITHPEVDISLLKKLVKKLESKKTKLFFEPVAAGKLGKKKTKPGDMQVDVAVVCGGDGTLLWATENLGCSPLFLGIKTGRVGFLKELDEKTMLHGIDRMFKGDFWVDERTRLLVNGKYEALNEAVILPEKPGRLLEFRIYFEGKELSQFRADGIIAATPTGSTGHALSAGGPVVHPQSSVYIIVPMVPFMRHQPPMIVPDESEIVIETISKKSDLSMVIDGDVVRNFKYTEKISLTKSTNKVRFIRFGDKRWKHIINKGF